MLKLSKTLRLLSKSFWMASLLGCAHFPELHPHLIFLSASTCTEYAVVNQADSCNMTYIPIKDWPIEHCDKFTALPPEDIAALKEYQKKQCTTQ